MGRSDEELVARARAGEESAFEAIYDRYARGVLVFCTHMLGSRDEAEDALQLIFVSAYQALRGGDNGISLRPWLYTIARNRCLSELRARPGVVCVEEPVMDRSGRDGVADQVQRREELRELLGEIWRLPADQRAALVLFELGDHSHAEIATVLGVRREKVKALIFQSREALVRGRQARDSSCAEVRELLATVRGKVLPRSMTRAHIDRCASCAAFEHEVRRQRAALALILPVGLVGELKASVLGSALSGGGGIAAGGIGASGGGAALAGGAAAGSGAAAGGGSGAGAVAAGTATGLTGAGAAGGLTSAGTGACGLGMASAAPATAVATGLTAGGTELAVVGGAAGASSTAIATKIAAAVVIATGVVGASHAPGALPAPIPIISQNPAAAAPATPAAFSPGAAKLSGTPGATSTSGTSTSDAWPNPIDPNAASTAEGGVSPTTGAFSAAGATSPMTAATTGTDANSAATGASTATGASPARGR